MLCTTEKERVTFVVSNCNRLKMPSEFKFKVPRLYKAATKIVKSVKEEGGDTAELVNQYKKKTNIKALSALVQRVLDSEKVLDQVIENSGILKNEKGADPWLYRVLITELLLGKKRLPVGCKPIQTVLAFGPKLTIEHRKLKKGKREESDTEESGSDSSDDDDEELSDKETSKEEQEPPQKKTKKRRNKKRNKSSAKQPKSAEDQSADVQKELTTPTKSEDIGEEEPKSASKKPEEYISIKSSAVQAKRGRNLMKPKLKKFMSPKQQNLFKVKQFAKRAHSQTPKGKKFAKDKPRYFEVPSSV